MCHSQCDPCSIYSAGVSQAWWPRQVKHQAPKRWFVKTFIEPIRKRVSLTSETSFLTGSETWKVDRRGPSRDCIKESMLNPAVLGDGLGGTPPFSLRPFRSRLVCLLFLSMTISMLSIGLNERGASAGSALMGVIGVGDRSVSRLVEAFAFELERESERLRVNAKLVDPGSFISFVRTRNELASSAVRN